MNIIEAMAKLEELRKQHGDSFEVDVILKSSKEFQSSDKIFHTDSMYDVSELDPEDIVVLVDKLPPDFKTQDIVYCKVKNLSKAFDFARKRNAKIKNLEGCDDLIDVEDWELLCLANPGNFVWKTNALGTKWLEYQGRVSITAEEAAMFCKWANEYRQKQKC